MPLYKLKDEFARLFHTDHRMLSSFNPEQITKHLSQPVDVRDALEINRDTLFDELLRSLVTAKGGLFATLVVPVDRSFLMIYFSIMKTASVADLRNQFRRISAWIEEGETVEIVKRGKAFARLVPIVEPAKAAKIDFRAQRKRIWGSRVFSSSEVRAMDDAEIEGDEG